MAPDHGRLGVLAPAERVGVRHLLTLLRRAFALEIGQLDLLHAHDLVFGWVPKAEIRRGEQRVVLLAIAVDVELRFLVRG